MKNFSLLLLFVFLVLPLGCGIKGGDSNTVNFGRFDLKEDVFGLFVSHKDDYSVGTVSIFPLEDPSLLAADILPGPSDIFIACHEGSYYKIESFNLDRVTKYDLKIPQRHITQWSTRHNGQRRSSGPIDMIFSSNWKYSYIIQYEKDKVWVVDHNNNGSHWFKGEIDLSGFADQDGIPEVSGGIIDGEKLILTLQRLDRTHPSGVWQTTNSSYLAIYDLKLHQLVLLPGMPLPGYELRTRNPVARLQQMGRFLMVAGASNLVTMDPMYSGVEIINLDRFEHVNQILNGMNVIQIAWVAPQLAYALVYKGYDRIELISFNPTTGQLLNIPGALGKKIIGAFTDIVLDPKGVLWLLEAGPIKSVNRYNPITGELITGFTTKLNPKKLYFCK